MASELAAEYRRRSSDQHDICAQMPVLYAWARQCRTVIELGVRTGNSTSALLAGLEFSGGSLWSVDIAEPQVPGWWRDLPQWKLLVADDLSPEALAFCPRSADLLFIDTSHFYPHTLRELEEYAPRVTPGGVVLLHDTDRAEWPDVGRSLDEWCAGSGADWYAHPLWHGLGVIEIP